MEKRIYAALPTYSLQQAIEICNQCDDIENCALLPLSVGFYWDDWKLAQNICIRLFVHHNTAVRANAVLGLSYIARNHGKLDKHIVKPYLLQELRQNETYRWRIINALQDINLFLGWHMAEKAIQKYKYLS